MKAFSEQVGAVLNGLRGIDDQLASYGRKKVSMSSDNGEVEPSTNQRITCFVQG